jgi:hypothetical protein
MAGKHATLQIEDGRTNPAFSCPHVKFKFTAFQVECMSPDRIDNNTQQHTTTHNGISFKDNVARAASSVDVGLSPQRKMLDLKFTQCRLPSL